MLVQQLAIAHPRLLQAQSPGRNLSAIKRAIEKDFALSQSTAGSVLEGRDLDIDELKEEVSAALTKVLQFLDANEALDAQIAKEAADKKGKASARKQKTVDAVLDIKSQLRILILVIKNALSRDFEKREMSDEETQDIVDRIFKDFDRKLGVVPRLSGVVSEPSYIQITRLKLATAKLEPDSLPTQLWTEMTERKLSVEGDELVQAGAQEVVPRRYVQRDHMQPKVDVFRRLREMVAAIRIDPQFRDEMLKLDQDIHGGEQSYFKSGRMGKVDATRVLDRTYNETLDNLWFLECRDNSEKGDDDPVGWILDQPFFGLAFFEHIYITVKRLEDSSLIESDLKEEFSGRCIHYQDSKEARQQVLVFLNQELIDTQYILLQFKTGKTLLQEAESWVDRHDNGGFRVQAMMERRSRRYKLLVKYIQRAHVNEELSVPQKQALLKQIETGWKELKSSYRESRFQVGYHMERSPSLPLGSSPSAATGGSVSSDAGEVKMDLRDVHLTELEQILKDLRAFMLDKPQCLYGNLRSIFIQYSSLEASSDKDALLECVSDDLSTLLQGYDQLVEDDREKVLREFLYDAKEPPTKRRRISHEGALVDA